jgi:putative membrane protein
LSPLRVIFDQFSGTCLPWFHGKLLLVLILSGVHGFFSRCVKVFAADRNPYSQKFYRIFNEVPTVLMIGIVILVIVKPFS